ncbi:uncharacterized protein LOC135819220 [Sycon ciliatum]|uniref:uncharacterized protein LOC135819220 n=1 Tax=Sycon ciliatum TaxID=27933 RepID=UPI0031F621B4
MRGAATLTLAILAFVSGCTSAETCGCSGYGCCTQSGPLLSSPIGSSGLVVSEDDGTKSAVLSVCIKSTIKPAPSSANAVVWSTTASGGIGSGKAITSLSDSSGCYWSNLTVDIRVVAKAVGVYTVNVTTSAASYQKTIPLRFEGMPVISASTNSHLKSRAVEEGEGAQFVCVFPQKINGGVTWTQPYNRTHGDITTEQVTDDETRTTLTIPVVTTNMTGLYSCSAYKASGDLSYLTFNLTVSQKNSANASTSYTLFIIVGAAVGGTGLLLIIVMTMARCMGSSKKPSHRGPSNDLQCLESQPSEGSRQDGDGSGSGAHEAAGIRLSPMPLEHTTSLVSLQPKYNNDYSPLSDRKEPSVHHRKPGGTGKAAPDVDDGPQLIEEGSYSLYAESQMTNNLANIDKLANGNKTTDAGAPDDTTSVASGSYTGAYEEFPPAGEPTGDKKIDGVEDVAMYCDYSEMKNSASKSTLKQLGADQVVAFKQDTEGDAGDTDSCGGMYSELPSEFVASIVGTSASSAAITPSANPPALPPQRSMVRKSSQNDLYADVPQGSPGGPLGNNSSSAVGGHRHLKATNSLDSVLQEAEDLYADVSQRDRAPLPGTTPTGRSSSLKTKSDGWKSAKAALLGHALPTYAVTERRHDDHDDGEGEGEYSDIGERARAALVAGPSKVSSPLPATPSIDQWAADAEQGMYSDVPAELKSGTNATAKNIPSYGMSDGGGTYQDIHTSRKNRKPSPSTNAVGYTSSLMNLIDESKSTASCSQQSVRTSKSLLSCGSNNILDDYSTVIRPGNEKNSPTAGRRQDGNIGDVDGDGMYDTSDHAKSSMPPLENDLYAHLGNELSGKPDSSEVHEDEYSTPTRLLAQTQSAMSVSALMSDSAEQSNRSVAVDSPDQMTYSMPSIVRRKKKESASPEVLSQKPSSLAASPAAAAFVVGDDVTGRDVYAQVNSFPRVGTMQQKSNLKGK